MTNILIYRDGQSYGPYTLEQVQGYVADGTLNSTTDLAWCEGMTEWLHLKDVLLRLTPAAPPVPPPPPLPLLSRHVVQQTPTTGITLDSKPNIIYRIFAELFGINRKPKTVGYAFAFLLLTGVGHRFYLGKIKSGLLQLVTLGGCGLWIIIDGILLLSNQFKDGDGNRLINRRPLITWPIFVLWLLLIFGSHAPSKSNLDSSENNKVTDAVKANGATDSTSDLSQPEAVISQTKLPFEGRWNGTYDAGGVSIDYSVNVSTTNLTINMKPEGSEINVTEAGVVKSVLDSERLFFTPNTSEYSSSLTNNVNDNREVRLTYTPAKGGVSEGLSLYYPDKKVDVALTREGTSPQEAVQAKVDGGSTSEDYVKAPTDSESFDPDPTGIWVEDNKDVGAACLIIKSSGEFRFGVTDFTQQFQPGFEATWEMMGSEFKVSWQGGSATGRKLSENSLQFGVKKFHPFKSQN